MKVLVVSEGKHELGDADSPGALTILVSRLMNDQPTFTCEKFSDPKVRFRVHGQPGKSGRLRKRALAWCQHARQAAFDAVVIVIDQDDDPDRHQAMDAAQDEPQMTFQRAIGVAVRTFDAWFLADEKALSRVLAVMVQRQPDPEKLRQPKAVCAALIEKERPGLSPAELYQDAARSLDLEQLAERCPIGFAPFAHQVRGIVMDHLTR